MNKAFTSTLKTDVKYKELACESDNTNISSISYPTNVHKKSVEMGLTFQEGNNISHLNSLKNTKDYSRERMFHNSKLVNQLINEETHRAYSTDLNVHPVNYKCKSGKDGTKSFSAGSLLCGSSRRKKTPKQNQYPIKMNNKSSVFALSDESHYNCGNPHKSRMVDDPFESPDNSISSPHQTAGKKPALGVIFEEEVVATLPPAKVCDLTLMQNITSTPKTHFGNYRPVKPARSPSRNALSSSKLTSAEEKDLKDFRKNCLGETKGDNIKNVSIKTKEIKKKGVDLSNDVKVSTLRKFKENNPPKFPMEVKTQAKKKLQDSKPIIFNKQFNYPEYSQTTSRKPKMFLEMFDKFESSSFTSPDNPKLMANACHDNSKISIGDLLQRDNAITNVCDNSRGNEPREKANKSIAHLSDKKTSANLFNISLGLPRKSEYVSKPGAIKTMRKYSDVKSKIESDRKEFFKKTIHSENTKNVYKDFKNLYSSSIFTGLPRSRDAMSKPGTIKPNIDQSNHTKTTVKVKERDSSKMVGNTYQVMELDKLEKNKPSKDFNKKAKVNKPMMSAGGDCNTNAGKSTNSRANDYFKVRNDDNSKISDIYVPPSPELENFSISFDDSSFTQSYNKKLNGENVDRNSSEDDYGSECLSSPADSLYLKSYKEQLVIRARDKEIEKQLKPSETDSKNCEVIIDSEKHASNMDRFQA